MGRLTLDIPTVVGTDQSGTACDGATPRRERDPATATILRWFDCWAGR